MINLFKEQQIDKKLSMDKRLKDQKLENVRSLWYFVTSTSKKSITGSKG